MLPERTEQEATGVYPTSGEAVVVEGEDMFEGAVCHPSLTLRSRQHVWEQSMKPALGVSIFGMDATEPRTAAWIFL